MYNNIDIFGNRLTNCLIGTAGWHYKDWDVLFYPEREMGTFDKLRYYSQFFDCVEVDSVFYNLCTKKMAKNWMERVRDNKNFMFSLKLDADFTNRDNFSGTELKLLLAFMDELSVYGKLESVLLQFSHNFLNTKQNRYKI